MKKSLFGILIVSWFATFLFSAPIVKSNYIGPNNPSPVLLAPKQSNQHPNNNTNSQSSKKEKKEQNKENSNKSHSSKK